MDLASDLYDDRVLKLVDEQPDDEFRVFVTAIAPDAIRLSPATQPATKRPAAHQSARRPQRPVTAPRGRVDSDEASSVASEPASTTTDPAPTLAPGWKGRNAALIPNDPALAAIIAKIDEIDHDKCDADLAAVTMH